MNSRDLAELVSQHTERNGRKIPATFIYAQMAHETGGFKSELALKHNNFGGVTQVAPNGLDQPDGSNYYMDFGSPDEFAEYYGNYLSKYAEDGIYEATTIDQYANTLKRGGYYGDTVENYAAGMKHFAGQDSILELSSYAKEIVDPQKPIVEQEVVPDATFEDKFYDSVYDSAIWGSFRTAGTLKDAPDDDTFTLTQEDIDAVQKELGGDYSATLWVAQNARSATQLAKLTRMKKEDLERRKRIDRSSIGFDTFGTVLGLAVDPLNYIPLLGTTGKVGTLSRYLKLAAANTAISLPERGITQAVTGYEQDYKAAAFLSAIAGGAVPAVFDMAGIGLRKGLKYVEDAQASYINAQAHAQDVMKGKKPSSVVQHMDDLKVRLEKLHDPAFAKGVSVATPENGVYILSKEDAKRVLRDLGEDAPDGVKGIFDDATGISVLVKDNLKDTDDLLKTILHEKGAHGLKHILSEHDLKQVYADLKFRMRNNPSPALKRAMKRAVNKEDPEEVLGYFVEEAKSNNPLIRDIKKKFDKGMNTLGVKGRMTEGDFIDLITRSASSHKATSQGYRTLPDGTSVYHNFRFSETSILNPQKLDEVNELVTGEIGGLGKMLARWKLFATPYTLAATSASKTLQKFIGRSLDNPYMNKALDFVTTESQKRTLIGRLNEPYNNYMKVRQEALVARTGQRGRFSNALKQQYNEECIQCYNFLYGNNKAGYVGKTWSPEVMKGAKALKELRDAQIDLLKNCHKIFGEGKPILPDEWKTIDDEFWRFIDDDKRAHFVSMFDNDEKAIEFLTKYGKQAAKRNVIKQRLEERLEKEWRAKIEQGVKDGSIKKAPERVIVSEEMVEAEVEKEAKAWATGVVDKNTSSMTVGNIRSNEVGQLDFLQHRFPMDTSTTLKDPWGMDFSFDEAMRSYDFDSTVPFLLNRTAGEISLHNLFSNKVRQNVNAYGFEENVLDNIVNLRKQIENELQSAVNNKKISRSAMYEDLKAFDFTIDRLRGISSQQEPKTYFDAFTRMLSTMSYARNGANMGINQLSEISGTMAYAGADAALDLIPIFGKTIREMRYGEKIDDIINEAQHFLFGENTYQYLWHNARATSSDMFSRVDNTGSKIASGLDAVAGVVNTGASAVSSINGLQKLTNFMIESARKHTLIDVAMWCNGKEFSKWRNPFSMKKLEAAGIKDVEAFKETLRTYMKRDKNGVITDMDLAGLARDNATALAKLRTLVDYQAQRCITQETIGTTNLLKESSPFWRVFFQFKDFTMRATHSQTLRAVFNHELDDVMSTIFGVATNAAAVATVAYMRGWAMFGDNEYKRREYLDKYMNPTALAYAGVVRSPIGGSAFSASNDIAEAIGLNPFGMPTIRTTVNRRQQNKNLFEDPKGSIGGLIAQLPAVDTALDIGKTALLPFQEKEMTQRQLKEALSLFPGQNNLLIMKLREEMFDELHLAER